MKEIKSATANDLKEILELQYIAYQSEAKLLNNPNIPPLKQTIKDTQSDFEKGIILKMVENGKIIGSIRGYVLGDTVYIGKLMVLPDYQRQGNGTLLLQEIEKHFNMKRFELFTSTLSKSNIRLYKKNGYRPFDEKQISDQLAFIYFEKIII